MEMKLIKSDNDYQKSLKRFDEIFDSIEGTPKGDEAELLALLIESYEEEHFSIEAPDPIEAIKFRMEQMGLNRSDLASVIGYKSRVSEILSKKRRLTLEMIRKLHDSLKIPYEALISEYKTSS